MLFNLFLLFTVVPLAELFILIKVGEVIGAFNTVMLVIVTGIVGAYLAKLEGLRVFYSFQKEVNDGRMPAAPLLDGFLIFVGALLLITPGIVTDIIGFILIIPVTRSLIKHWLKNSIQDKFNKRDNVFVISNFKVDKEG